MTINLSDTCSYKNNTNIFHEAGYDAYVTGCVFTHLLHQTIHATTNGLYKNSYVNILNIYNNIYKLHLTSQDSIDLRSYPMVIISSSQKVYDSDKRVLRIVKAINSKHHEQYVNFMQYKSFNHLIEETNDSKKKNKKKKKILIKVY